MVSVVILCVEILLDVIGLCTGIIVLVRAIDNRIQQAWGLLAVTLSLLLLCDNIEWIWIFSQQPHGVPLFIEVPMDHLSMWHMVRTVVFFQFFSLFPVASLRPGWMTATRIINHCIPIFIIICIACCYQLFNGHYTVLRSFSAIGANLQYQDVQLRLILFLLTVITPSMNFLFPYMKRWVPIRRKQSSVMAIYMICFGMIMSGYIWLMLGTSGVSFNLFGCIVILPTIYISILYIGDGNPLSLPPSPVEDLESEDIEAIREIEVSQVVLELCKSLDHLMKTEKPFIKPQYSLPELLKELDTNEHRINKAFHYDGFTGFRDYINFHRLQYFKEQAVLDTNLTVKELMFKSGFTSRSSFYRYFANIEKMSPSEYMEILQKKQG